MEEEKLKKLKKLQTLQEEPNLALFDELEDVCDKLEALQVVLSEINLKDVKTYEIELKTLHEAILSLTESVISKDTVVNIPLEQLSSQLVKVEQAIKNIKIEKTEFPSEISLSDIQINELLLAIQSIPEFPYKELEKLVLSIGKKIDEIKLETPEQEEFDYNRLDRKFNELIKAVKNVSITVSAGGGFPEKSQNDLSNLSSIVRNNTHTGENEARVRMTGHICNENSTQTPLLANTTFTGAWQDALNYGVITVSIATDKNSATDGLVIEWSSDMITVSQDDKFTILANQGKTFTFGPASRYVRVKYTNGPVNQGLMELETSLRSVYVKPSSHRTSDSIVGQDDAELVKAVLTGENPSGSFVNIGTTDGGSLKTNIVDNYGFTAENTPMSELRAVEPVRLIGSGFIGTTLDTNFWSSTLTGSGAVAQASGQITLTTGTTANSTSRVDSVRRARYTGGSSNRYRAAIQLTDGETGTPDNIRRWGAYDTNDGAFFELNGTTMYVVTRKGGNDVKVAMADWNGKGFTVDTKAHTYEIYWTNLKVWFIYGDEVCHTITSDTTTWSSTVNLPIRIENINTNGLTSNVQISCRVQTIYRLGALETQPISRYQSGTTAGLILKYGPGNLHGLIIGGVAQNSVITLYDNTAASGTIIWASGTMGAQTQPFALDFHSLPFSTGLTLVISGASSSVTIIYE